MSRQLRDQRHRTVHTGDNQLVDPGEIVAEQSEQRVERGAPCRNVRCREA